MAKVTDEMLMAYADGALSALGRAKVEAFLQANPEARRRVEVFRATGAPIAKLYEKPMAEPVPAYLKDFVLNYPADAALPKAQLSWVGLFQRLVSRARILTSIAQWFERPAQPMRWQLAAASAALLALGVGAGAFLYSGGSSSDLVAFHDGHIYASGALRNVLEEEPSGRDARIGGIRGDAVTMRANLTFKSEQQTFCREYEIATPGARGFVGLGCRDSDGKWALEVHIPSGGSATGGVKPAGGSDNDALDEIVNHMIDGDAFGNEQEAAAIKSGWK